MRLQNKSVLITGGNSGIGLGIATKLGEEGARGVIVGRNPDTLASASHSLGDDFVALRCDVTKLDELEDMFRRAEEAVGKLDVLVVNAGGAIGAGSVQPFAGVDERSFAAMTDLNFKSVFFTVQKALPNLNNGASIVLVASIAAHKGFAGFSITMQVKQGLDPSQEPFRPN